jgi:hypothetical protein
VIYLDGNTVRLTCKFSDWDGAIANPSIVKLIIYNSRYQKINEFSLGPGNKTPDGAFYFDWIPVDTGEFIYEWYAELDGTPSLTRERISIRKL